MDLSRRAPQNGERDCERLMSKRFGLTMPIKACSLKGEDAQTSIPFLKFRDWLGLLLEHNCLHIFCGLLKPDRERERAILEHFWRCFEVQNPQHPIFQKARSGECSLGRTMPLLLHGDEGRSKKRSAFLILNLHSPLGRGVDPQLQSGQRRRKYLKLEPNFKGHSYTNRFLVSAVPKASYTGPNESNFSMLLDAVAEELLHVSTVGVESRSQTWHACCIGIVGDWPWLAKCGLDRSFMNVEKHKENARGVCKGICHLCQAGQPGTPYEQIASKTPLWQNTMLAQPPFSRPSPFQGIPHVEGEPPTLFHFDLFHCWHLGMARNYLGSMLALLSQLEPGSNVDLRFEQLSEKYFGWCRQHHRQAHCQRITKEHLGWLSTSYYPTGGWHKGDLSTSLMLWVEARFHTEDWSHDSALQLAGEAAEAINCFISKLYHGGAFLSPSEAKEAGEFGMRFLRRYNSLAVQAHRNGQRFWLIMPKAHAMHHLILGLLNNSQTGLCLNPLCTSVQQDEDYIGRGSRLSRHVSSVACAERVVSRHLQSVYNKFVECGYLIRAKWAAH